ncbi:MAG: alkaline phosphatase D family protein [Pseudomonadota bacterium]
MKLSRRDFIQASLASLSTIVVSSGLSGCSLNDDDDADPSVVVSFNHGVASGDPLKDSVILWTRVTPEQDANIMVSWEVHDMSTNELVNSGSTLVTEATDYTLKVDAINLSAGKTYQYQFFANGVASPMGETKTLPEGSIDAVRFAAISCSNYPAGYFNVYADIAIRTDIDAVLHLGDYIYEYGADGYATERAEELGRTLADDNNTETLTLTDYRKRYALYRSDEDLQACHQNHPFIVVWDDHEVTNDSYKDGAENHDESEGDYQERKRQALQAYFEWMPIRVTNQGGEFSIYRSFSFGDLVDLHMLDTRIEARDKVIALTDFANAETGVDFAGFQTALMDSNRSLLGSEQLGWLSTQMATSNAQWQVLGQQVLMGRMLLPGAVVTQSLSIEQFGTIAQTAIIAQRAQNMDPTLTPEELAFLEANQVLLTEENLALIQLPALPYNLDAWDGFAFEREVLLNTVADLDKNLVVLAGDTHNAWANNIVATDPTSGEAKAVGVEFATASVSSPGLEQYLNLTTAEVVAATEAGLEQIIGDLQYCNLSDRGYMVVSFTAEEASADWVFVDTIYDKNYSVLEARATTKSVLPGADNRQVV